MKHIKIFSFFSGAGFLDLGFEKAGGYDIVFINEFSATFNRIYQYAREKMGIKTCSSIEYKICSIESLDIKKLYSKVTYFKQKSSLVGFIGGPPCPDFSVAGKNKGKEGENGRLSKTYIDLICHCKPDFFLFENVKGLYRTRKHREFFYELCAHLIKNKFILTHTILNAFEYGVAQDRDRLILFGVRSDVLKESTKCHDNGYLLDFPWSSTKKYKRELIERLKWPAKEVFKERGIKNIPRGIIKKLTVEYWWNKNNVRKHPNQDMYFKPKGAIVKFKTIEEGDVSQLSFKRLHRWRYSPTAAYGNNEVHLHPYLPRRISVAEALAIQSLPPEFELPVDIPLSAAFKTIGNGVPYLLALSIAKNIKTYLKDVSKN